MERLSQPYAALQAGQPWPMGASCDGGGVNFAVFAGHATQVDLCLFDDSGRVIYLGSLTKNLLPGVRLGFIVADEELILELRALRRYMYRHPPLNNQRAMALFLSMGYYDDHARRLRDALARKWRLITRALHAHLPELQCTGSAGGSSLWVQGPASLDAWALQRAAARQGVLIEPGDIHFTGAERPRQFFRLGYGAIADELIEPGIAVLARAWREMAATGSMSAPASETLVAEVVPPVQRPLPEASERREVA